MKTPAPTPAPLPPAHLAAIRERFNPPTVESRLQMLCDISDLLTQWDTRESALRALVAQWRATGADDLNDYAVGYLCCADALERLLSGPQP